MNKEAIDKLEECLRLLDCVGTREKCKEYIADAIALLKEQRTTVEVVSVTKENGSVNLFAFRESKDAIKCFCYWKEKGATVTSGEVDIQ